MATRVAWQAGAPLHLRCEVAHLVVFFGEHHDPARRVEERYGAPGGIADVDPRRRREVVGLVGPRAVELAVADDDTAGIEDFTLVLGHGFATPRRQPGDALGKEPACTSCSCSGQEVARPFGADPVVALGVVGDLLDVVGRSVS